MQRLLTHWSTLFPLLVRFICLLIGIGILRCPAGWADPGIVNGSAHDNKTLSVPAVVAKVRPSVVTVLTRGVPATPS